MRWKHVVAVTPIGLIFLAFFYAFSRTQESANQRHLLAILPLTGPAASFGHFNQEATNLFFETEGSESDSLIWRHEFADSKTSAKDAVQAYQVARTQEDIQVVSTELSSVALALAPLTEEDDVLMMAIAAAPDLERYPNVFRTYVDAFKIANSIVLDLKSRQPGNLALSILYLPDDYGLSVAEAIQATAPDSWSVSRVELSTSADIKSTVATAQNQQAMVVVGYANVLANAIAELQQQYPEAVKYATPEVMFADVVAKLDLDDRNLRYVSIVGPSKKLLVELADRLNRPVNPIDIFVFDGLNCILQVSQSHPGLQSGSELMELMKGKTFKSLGREITVNVNGSLEIPLEVRSGSDLKFLLD
jgi:ABC-type branched-subunit amino acid transport system substrate-binding protein